MSTSSPERDALQFKSALVVGVGGLGYPAALALAEAGLGRLVLCDDDLVDRTNLHRQILFDEADVGKDKLDAAAEGLYRLGARPGSIELVRSRFLPDNARALARGVDFDSTKDRRQPPFGCWSDGLNCATGRRASADERRAAERIL